MLLLSRGGHGLEKKCIKAAVANACPVCRFGDLKSNNSPPDKLSSTHFECGRQTMEDLKVHYKQTPGRQEYVPPLFLSPRRSTTK